MRIRPALLLASGLAVALSLAGCPWTPPDTNPSNNRRLGNQKLVQFGSDSELLGYLKDRVRDSVSSSGGGLYRDVLATAGAAPAADAANEDAGGGTSYSTTNIQEEGVDESDLFKSDGQFFYIARGNTVRVVKAAPATELAQVGSIELEGHVDSLYLLDKRLIALVQKFESYGGWYAAPAIWPPYFASSKLQVYDIDISNPAAPAVLAKSSLEGNLVSSRLTNGRLILVLSVVPKLPDNINTAAISGLTLEGSLPRFEVNSVDAGPMVAPVDWWHPIAPYGYNTTAVVTLDAANVASILGSVAVMATAETIYASTKAVYVSNTGYDEAANYAEVTDIHMLAFDDNGVAKYVASGSVRGRLLNQFSLGEYEGDLRLATHINDFFFSPVAGGVAIDVAAAGGDATTSSDAAVAADEAPPAEPQGPFNAVYVLRRKESTLDTIGKIDNIAPGERLYSARFIGKRGFLVTFVQIDPLFVLDLSNPASPTIAGELKIPGYSDYLHPVGENLLIGVGRSVKQQPWGGVVPWQLQLSLFNVADLANPTLVQQISVGGPYSYSDVSQTHKAFTFLPDRGLLAITGTLYDENAETTGFRYDPFGFTGALCYQVAETGFTELGRVATAKADSASYEEWRRAAVINDTVYALSNNGVRSGELSNFAQNSQVLLPAGPGDYAYDMIDYAGGGAEPAARR